MGVHVGTAYALKHTRPAMEPGASPVRDEGAEEDRGLTVAFKSFPRQTFSRLRGSSAVAPPNSVGSIQYLELPVVSEQSAVLASRDLSNDSHLFETA